MARLVGPIFAIIDGLEENDQVEAFASALSGLCSSNALRLIFLSQISDEISRALTDHFGPQNPILITDHTSLDINQFAVEKSATMVERKQELKSKESFIAVSLQGRAQGMFQWVNSALDFLEKEVDDPRDVERLLGDLPSDLIASYEKTFERLARNQGAIRQSKTRLALQFLAASGTTVSPVDLQAAISIFDDENRKTDEDSKTEEGKPTVDRLVDRNEPLETMDEATSKLRQLLGSLVDFTSDGSIRLAHPSFRAALLRPAPTSVQVGLSARYKFTIEEAHYELLKVCMLLCGKSTLVHANAFAQTRPPLVEYAWTYWAYHFHQSKLSFDVDSDTEEAQKLVAIFNEMIWGVSGAALAYIDALLLFLTQPLRAVPGRFNDREYTLSLQRAQESLIQPTKELCSLRGTPSLAYHLCEAKKTVQSLSKHQEVAKGHISNTWQKSSAVETVRAIKKRYIDHDTEVQRLRLDEMNDQAPWLLKPSGSVKQVLNIARHLRLVALRFAVDPIYSALILTADGQSFSPLHPLLYISQLFEEAGTYPYWKRLPPTSDLLDSFICEQTDPEYDSAKFVLHCFEWRDYKKVTDENSIVGHYVRSHQTTIIGPRPSGHHLNRVSTENIEQVRRLHKMPSDRYIVAAHVYGLLQSTDEAIRNGITKPLSLFHFKMSFMIEDEEIRNDPNIILPAFNPEGVMTGLNPPDASNESPLKQFTRAIPHLLSVYFVKYVVALLEAFGALTKKALAVHFARLEVAVAELNRALVFFSRLRLSENEVTRLRGWYLFPGLLFFLIRCRYFALFGAYYMSHSWWEFKYALEHPAAYLDLQNNSGFLLWLTTVLRVFFYTGLGETAIGLGMNEEIANTTVAHVVNSYGVFHFLCTIERSLFAMGTVVATLLSCSLLMMRDQKSLSEVWNFSIFWWFLAFFQLASSASNTAAIQAGANLGGIFLMTIFQLLLIFLAVKYHLIIIAVSKFFLLPLTVPVMFLWNAVLHSYICFMKTCGFFLILYMAFRAFKFTHKFMWDPYDIEGSLSEILKVSQLARSTLQGEEAMRIGRYPLGQSLTSQNEAPPPPPPKSAIHSDISENLPRELGNAVIRATEALPEAWDQATEALPGAWHRATGVLHENLNRAPEAARRVWNREADELYW